MNSKLRHNLASAALAAVSIVTAACAAGAPLIYAVPPATSTVRPVAKVQKSLKLQGAAPVFSIVLPAPRTAELVSTRTLPVGNVHDMRATIGIGRPVAAAEGTLALGGTKWQPVGDGMRAVQFQVTSTGAAGVRVALQMQSTDPDVTLSIAGSNSTDVYGPFVANQVAETTAKFGEWWSPVLEGQTATIEIDVPATFDASGLKVTVAAVSHLVRAGANLVAPARGDANLGTSATCEINWKCEPPTPSPPALVNAANAVARIIFTEANGGTFLCTGTLLNDSRKSGTPYLFTAAHCMDDAYAAQTSTTFWFLDAPDGDCGHDALVGDYVQLFVGSALLGNSVSQDWALIRLGLPPPAGTTFSAWDATPISSGSVIDLHHPHGDTKKFAGGSLQGYANIYTTYDAAPQFKQVDDLLAVVLWNTGLAEPGSSGSSLLTLGSGGYYSVRGALTGGADFSCTAATTSPVFFSRVDQMLPLMRDYLTPGVTVANTAVVVEFYNQALDDFFITQDPGEINVLDTGEITGWVRTGLRFLAYTAPVNGASPVCRFYLNPPYGSSHFYSATLSDCEALINDPKQFPGWSEERPNAFYVNVPNASTGDCQAGTTPVYRLYHSANINHRFTTDISVHDRLAQTAGWSDEGVKMCVPNGN